MNTTFTPIKICNEHNECDNNCRKLYNSLVEPQKLVNLQKNNEKCDIDEIPKNKNKLYTNDEIGIPREILESMKFDNSTTFNRQPKLSPKDPNSLSKCEIHVVKEKSFSGDKMREIAKNKIVEKYQIIIEKHSNLGQFKCYCEMNVKFIGMYLNILNNEFAKDGIIFSIAGKKYYKGKKIIRLIAIDWSPKNINNLTKGC